MSKPANYHVTPEKLIGSTARRVAWIAANLRIETEERMLLPGQDSLIVPLTPKPGQVLVWRAMEKQEKAHLPIRIIVLKARRCGCSTAVEADFFTRVHFLPNKHAIVAAHETLPARKIFAMSKRFQTYLPKCIRRDTQASNAYEIQFSDPHASSMTVTTAGSPAATRAGGYSYIHASEYAHWEKPRTVMSALGATTARRPGTVIVIESTANGVGDDFHGKWLEAERRVRNDPNDLNGYLPVFLSWLIEPSYQIGRASCRERV